MSIISNTDMTASMVACQVNLFDSNNEVYLRFLKNNHAARDILFSGYRMLRRENQIEPIEKSGDKEKLWEDAKFHTSSELSKDETVKYALGLYLLKMI